MHDLQIGQCFDHRPELGKGNAIRTGGQALDLVNVLVIARFPQPGVPGIDQIKRIVRDHRRS
jgi:hypothetical protein